MIEFTERSFLPFTDSNQLHVIHDSFVHGESGYNVSTPIQTCLINVHGRLLFVEQEKSFNLQTYLNEIPNGHSLELICADISAENKNGCLALLATLLTDRKVYTENQHCWIIFKSGDDVCAYIIEGDSGEAKPIDDVFSVFPELSLSVLPGAATRSACTESSFLRWSALGFDTGHAILSVSTIGTHAILDR
uniref:GCV_T domain-containing protein n=1 Tax=Heterorhabditis bacteriophora TaxID=37862 RepID=A0A1I7XMS0_HETBA